MRLASFQDLRSRYKLNCISVCWQQQQKVKKNLNSIYNSIENIEYLGKIQKQVVENKNTTKTKNFLSINKTRLKRN